MKHLMALILFCLSLNSICFADTATSPSFPVVQWVSKDTTDDVIIHNGTGAPITISITVANNSTNDAPGINVKNCGTTTHIEAGSTGICATQDARNPVTFSSDSPTDPAVGTYQITRK